MGNSQKKSVLGACGKLIATVGAVVGANFAGCLLAYRNNMDKINKKEKENNFMYTGMLGKRQTSIGPLTQNAYITGLTASVTVNVYKPMNEELYIEVTGVCANVKIVLPKDVRVRYEGQDKLALFEDYLVNQNGIDGPLVHIVRKSYLSKVTLVNAE